MEEQKLHLSDPEASTMAVMKQLANNEPLEMIDIDGEKLVNRTKLFLVARAYNSLNRIITLTQFLEKLEDKFISSVTEKIEDNPDNIGMISLAMETISKLLEDANNTVTQVLKDDKLQQIVINTTNIITPDGKTATIIDADSRDEVRNLAASLLQQLSNMSNGDNEVVDVEPEPEKVDDLNV